MQPYVLVLSDEQSECLLNYLRDHRWHKDQVPYSLYAYHTPGVKVVVYHNQKLVVQGKDVEDFVLHTLETEITHKPLYGYDRVNHPEWFEAHAGLDESGKGDLFGPLVAATVIADGTAVDFWLSKGLKESKAIKSDERLFKMEALVREPKGVVIETAYANMERYNELYAKFGNLNQLLAWMHARALDTALQKSTVQKGLLDQFVKAHLVQKFLKRSDFTLQQRVRAEEDPVVAAASIIARATYVRKLRDLSKEAGVNLPKGCGTDAQKALTTLRDTVGQDQLKRYAKMHFKTINEVLKS